MFEESEIINLILGLVSLLIVFYEVRKRHLPDFRMFYAGFLSIALARILTVAEGVFLGEILNIIEHLCYALSGFFFAWGSIAINKKRTPLKG